METMRLGGNTEGGVAEAGAAVVTTGEFAIAEAAAAAAAAAMAVVDVELDRLNDIAVVLTEPSSSGANAVNPSPRSKDQECTYLEPRPRGRMSQREPWNWIYFRYRFFLALLCFRLVRLVVQGLPARCSLAAPRCLSRFPCGHGNIDGMLLSGQQNLH